MIIKNSNIFKYSNHNFLLPFKSFLKSNIKVVQKKHIGFILMCITCAIKMYMHNHDTKSRFFSVYD